jgi:hypothetical protein
MPICGTAGRGRWNVRLLDDSIQQVPQGYQVIGGYYNAGTHHGLEVYHASKERARFWSLVGESQTGVRPHGRYVKLAKTKHFWHVIRVCYGRLLRMVGH